MGMQPLHGLRVVELCEGIAGPWAGRLLAGYGADVIKVEPPNGDRSRTLGPFPPDGHDPDTGALHLHLNTGKRSVVGHVGDETVGRLIAGADVVLQSDPDVDPATIQEHHPGLVLVTVTSFGLTGRYSGFRGEEIVHYAMGGPMSASGDPEREPVKMGGDLGQYQCGTLAAVATLASLAAAKRNGRAVHVDLSNVDTQVTSIDRRMTFLLYNSYRGENVPRSGGYSTSIFPGGCRPTNDGHVQVSTLMNWLPRMTEVMDDLEMSALYQDPAWILNANLPEAADARLLEWTLGRDKQQAMEEAQAGSWPITAVNRPVDVLSDPHFAERGFFSEVAQTRAGPTLQPGAPIRIEDGWMIQRPAPTIGEHQAELEAEEQLVRKVQERIDDELPLKGVRVLDMTVVWAGPYATQILGDMGADVVRVDNPWVFPTATRGIFPRPTKEMIADIGGIGGGYPDADPGQRPWNRFALFNAHARNKRSATLDLRQEEGREAFLRLVDVSDVMIENNSVDLVDRLGIGWDEIHARNPQLIMIRMPSVGLEGPYRSYLGFGVNFEALCGLGAIRGYRDADLSENEAVFHMDAASGSAGAFAALMALRRREITGLGEMVEVSQSENMLNHIGELLIDAGRTGAVHEPLGNRHRVYAPQGCYPCIGDDQWAVLSVTNDEQWKSLVQTMGSDDLANDVELDNVEGRQRRHDEIDERLAAWTSLHTAQEIFEACQQSGVPAAPVLHENEAFAENHFLERELFAPNGSADTGTHDYPTHMWRWTAPDMRFEALPILGGDNEAIFKDLLGMTDDEYAAFAEKGHIQLDYLQPDGTPY
jgi:crotonobetainyl-CoA:carnitine CoA-transferase CaiB-like acyl-CoA transferase